MLEIVLSVLGALGGGAIIIGGFAHWLGNLWAKRLIQNEKSKLDLEIEAHKVRLKKSEVFFLKELDAASELSAFHHSILPDYRYPEMTFHDACEELATDFNDLEKWVGDYIAKNGAVLPDKIMSHLHECSSIAGTSKFLIRNSDDVSIEAIKAAEKFWEELNNATREFIEHVRSQTST